MVEGYDIVVAIKRVVALTRWLYRYPVTPPGQAVYKRVPLSPSIGQFDNFQNR